MQTRKVKLKKRSQPEEPVTRKGIAIFVGLLILAVVGFIFGVRLGVARKDATLVNSSDLTTKGLYYQLKMEKTEYDVGEPISEGPDWSSSRACVIACNALYSLSEPPGNRLFTSGLFPSLPMETYGACLRSDVHSRGVVRHEPKPARIPTHDLGSQFTQTGRRSCQSSGISATTGSVTARGQ